MDLSRQRLIQELEAALPDHGQLRCFLDFIAGEPDCYLRSCAPGHLTASACVLHPQGHAMLLLHHRKLDRWLQPGGHADGEADLLACAQQEVIEETGLKTRPVRSHCIDIDRHLIPKRPGEPAHWHYDVRYLLQADSAAFRANHESLALAWVPLARVAQAGEYDGSLRRLAALGARFQSSDTHPRARNSLSA